MFFCVDKKGFQSESTIKLKITKSNEENSAPQQTTEHSSVHLVIQTLFVKHISVQQQKQHQFSPQPHSLQFIPVCNANVSKVTHFQTVASVR